jgi:phosphoadenosine phosphosulfate reductase
MQQIALLREITLPAMAEHSIKLLQANKPDGEYYGCFSGGKDSCVIKELARMAGVRVTWHYNMTTIDPPPVIYFMREHHPDVIHEKPKHGNFFARMEQKGFPTRRNPWCCADYKESAPPVGSVLILGVRAAESPRRKAAWKEISFHRSSKAWCVCPILGWSDEHIWEFIRSRNLPYCGLYDEGFKRLGCIGCPMARESGKLMQFARFPRHRALWRRAFDRIWERRSGSTQRDGKVWFGDVYFHNADEMWQWWLSNSSLPGKIGEDEEDSCQLALDMFSGEGE